MPDSIREALTMAFAASPPEEKEQNSASLEVTVGEEPSPSPAQGDTDNTSVADASTPENKDAANAASSDQPQGPGSPPSQAPGSPAAADPAPASWKADEKAAWAALPPAAKAAIKRREADTQRALSTSSGARKLEERFQTALTPYQKMLDGKGVKDAMSEVVAPILEIRRILEDGTPSQKAHAAYNIIKQFGIDVHTLDEYLVNGPGAVAPMQAPQASYTDTPEWRVVQSIAAREQAAENARLDTMIAEVSGDPLFEELREDTAAVLKSFADRGVSISLKDALNRAKLLRPDLSPVITQNQEVVDNRSDVSKAAALLASSRKAAKSVSGAPKSTPGAKPTSLRDTLVAAFEEHG